MAAIEFYAGYSSVNALGGSGLGFYGAGGFGASVPVGEYNQKTFITNSTGSTQGVECWNIYKTHPASGVIGQTGSGLPLTHIPNAQATLQPRFTHSSAVRVQNAEVRIYDRSNINNNPSGVTCWVAQLVHPNPVQGAGGSGNSTWTALGGSGSKLSLTASPGCSGQSPNGAGTLDTVHDYYLAISASPDSVGSKSFGLYLSLEYL